MDVAKPSLELVRSVTDGQVLRALMDHRRVTRAELATTIGISKPTAGESVRRLTERGLVVDTGDHTPGGRGRGRVGTYYALAPTVGAALAISIAPEGVVAETVDVYGDTLARGERSVDRPAQPKAVAAAVRDATQAACGDSPAPRVAVVSAADPVDRHSGTLVHLPDAPFLVGELDPTAVLGPYVDGPIMVDNDVNWAAQAEQANAGHDWRDFAYLYLGEGLGCAIVSDGDIRRGGSGLAGEIAHVLTTGRDGRATPLIEIFADLDVRRPGSTAIDVDRLLAAFRADAVRTVIGRAVAGVLIAVVAIADPDRVVIGGSWGPALLDAIIAAAGQSPRMPAIQATALGDTAAFTGARQHALARLRSAVAESR